VNGIHAAFSRLKTGVITKRCISYGIIGNKLKMKPVKIIFFLSHLKNTLKLCFGDASVKHGAKKHPAACCVSIILFIALGCSSDIRKDGMTVEKIIDSLEGEPVVPREANRIYITLPVNTAGVRNLSSMLFDKIKEYISLEGRLGVVSDESSSDLRLDVRIALYTIERLRFDAIGRPVQKRMRVTTDVRLVNLRKKKVIFWEADIQAFKVYSDLEPPIETEAQVLEYVLVDLAKRITSKTVTGWYTDQMTIIEKRKL
jgi:hypothetical protein